MAIQATLVNPTGSFTLGASPKNLVFKEGNPSNIVTAEQKEYLETYLDDKNKPLFTFAEVADVPVEQGKEDKKAVGKKIVKSGEQE